MRSFTAFMALLLVAACTEDTTELANPAPVEEGCDGGKSFMDDVSVHPMPADDTCDDLPEAWQRFATANRDCEHAGDCVVFGGTGTCDCAPTLGIQVINRRALAQARAFADRFASDECAELRARTGVCDEPDYGVACRNGFCSLGAAGCCFNCPEPPDPMDAAVDGPDHGSPGPVIDAGPIPDAGPPVDAGAGIDEGAGFDPNACDACAADEICVQFFDGDCGGGQPRCVPATPNCRAAECTAECEAEICDAPFGRCRDVPGCDGALRGALHCYGP
ncbi:MAG: hypothetical protein KC620_20085 [Myxococcales bacterium]|nr:hypothetical protein [Myxococcales bacterium]